MSIVDTILSEVKRIPPLSNAGAKLMGLLGKDHLSATVIAEIIAHDATLAAQILRVANSAAYRRKEDIGSIQLAISLLGNKTVLGVVMGYCMSAMYNRPLEGYEAPSGALWHNSVAAAIAAQLLTRYAKKPVSPELAYTAGLLHGIGKTVLSEYMKGSVREAVGQMDQAERKDFLKIEEDLLGTNHCEVGAALARQWHLPEALCEAIAYHHRPQEASEANKPLVYVVHVAAFTAMLQGIDTGADGLMYELDPSYDKYIHLPDARELEKIVMQVEKEYRKLTESFNP